MRFTVLPVGAKPSIDSPNSAYLNIDDWDDWGRFATQYYLSYVDDDLVVHKIGSVKIGQFKMGDRRKPDIPQKFENLSHRFFSLGQSQDYYRKLGQLSEDARTEIFKALRDVVYDLDLFEQARIEEVMSRSLMRDVSEVSVKGLLKRIVGGNLKLDDYAFSYTMPSTTMPEGAARRLQFNVNPYSAPPSNIHVLIGRNGVGKTRCLSNMARALINGSNEKVGTFIIDGNANNSFSNLVLVAFSVFDPFKRWNIERNQDAGVLYTHVGLDSTTRRGTNNSLESFENRFEKDFISALEICFKNSSTERWKAAVCSLESDPLFLESGFQSLVDDLAFETRGERAGRIFRELSAGHKIVLLIVTELVARVTERTLILMDEPESHLHPPLLSSLIRALSSLVRDQNGVAIIATHSPVILQEVPRQCAWKISRSGDLTEVDRPQIETFGENVGILTREVFGLELSKSGYHKILNDIVSEGLSFKQVLDHFDGQLGDEAAALVRILIANRDLELQNQDENS